MEVPAGLPKALACLVGYFAYETVGLVEDLPRPAPNPLDLPDMLFVRPTLILLFDRLTDELFWVAPVWPESGVSVAQAVERIETAQARLAGPLPSRSPADAGAVRPAAWGLDSGLRRGTRSTRPPPRPLRRDGRRGEGLYRGGRHLSGRARPALHPPLPLPPFDLYRALRRVNPSPFLYFLDLPGFALIGSSPEILVRARDGEVTIRPIAGTRPRGKTDAEDSARRDELLADPKERAEHLMLLDLGRNDVGRVAEPGSVRVTESYTVELYSHVMHIVSNVTGRLDATKDAIDALLGGFPAGTVSGAPKVRACQIIAELEPETRGAYAGGVGYFSPDGSMDSCIVLRTAVVKDGVMHVQAGAGIVADSDAAAEQRECEAKAGALLAAAREAQMRAADDGIDR